MECEVGLRRKTYNVLTGLLNNLLSCFFFFDTAHFKGSVLSVWTLVESVLTNDGQKKGQHAKMQVGFQVKQSCSPLMKLQGCENAIGGQ